MSNGVRSWRGVGWGGIVSTRISKEACTLHPAIDDHTGLYAKIKSGEGDSQHFLYGE
jgi:hypothetical protein